MHLENHDSILSSPPAIVSPWTGPDWGEIKTEILNWLKSLTEAIRIELKWYADKDDAAIEEWKSIQSRLVHGKWQPEISEANLEKFIKTLEDNDVIKETLRMIYGNRQETIAAIEKYQLEIDWLMSSNNRGLGDFIYYANRLQEGREEGRKEPKEIETYPEKLRQKMEKAQKRIDLIVGPSLYPMDNLLAYYTTIKRSPPSLEQSEHWVLLHTQEEAPLQSEKWNRWWSWLLQHLRKSLGI